MKRSVILPGLLEPRSETNFTSSVRWLNCSLHMLSTAGLRGREERNDVNLAVAAGAHKHIHKRGADIKNGRSQVEALCKLVTTGAAPEEAVGAWTSLQVHDGV